MENQQKTENQKKIIRRKSVYAKVMESDIDLCQRIFQQFDTQGKGYINHFDLKDALAQVSIEFFYAQCFHKMISELRDQSGAISFFDFTKLVVKQKKDQDNSDDI